MRITRHPHELTALLITIACGLLAGCGKSDGNTPPVGAVSGVVTLDGKPLDGAVVMFEPDHTRASNAKTDPQGKYELMFNDTIKGAAVGHHKVRISHRGDPLKGGMESVPPRYNMQTELTADVKAGANENVNFELTSK